MSDWFEDLESHVEENLEPFHVVLKKNNEKELLSWLNKVKDSLIEQAQTRTSKQRLHLTAYRGLSTNRWDRRRDFNSTRRLHKINKFIVNHLHDLTETKVSQMTRLKPAVEVLPSNDEFEDKAAAKVVGLLVKHLFELNNIDFLTQQMHRHCRIFGESFAFVLWDKDKGDLDPDYVEARDEGITEIKLDDGTTHDMRVPIKTGDIKYELELPWRVLLQRKSKIEDCDYVIRISVEPTEDLKIEYPDKAGKLKSQDDLRVFDIEDLSNRFLEGHTPVFHLWHKHTKYAPEGSYIKFTKECILEQDELGFTHGQLPIVRLTDLDVPDVLNGTSRYETILPLQKMYDNIQTLIAKNIYLTAHAKWLMPRGACKIEQLGNDNTIVQYQGNIAPQLAQVNPNPPEVYSYAESIKQNMQTVYGSQGIARGEVPKGITAASALQFLNEIENERNSTDIAKHGFLIKNLAKMSIAVAADNYDINDGRMLRIVGKNNSSMIKHFDVANLNKNYDVRYDNSTGLPETKSAKIQRILETLQRHPTLFKPERWEELLDLGNADRMVNLATAAIRSADSENEDIMAGNHVSPPEDWEDHIVHWESHVRAMQSRSFKEEASNEVQMAFRQHVFLTEALILEKMSDNPTFQAKVAELKLFPLFKHPNLQVPHSAEHQEAMVQGQANRGEPVTGAIPGQDIEDKREER
jgi:hypothetical protein